LAGMGVAVNGACGSNRGNPTLHVTSTKSKYETDSQDGFARTPKLSVALTVFAAYV